MDNINNFITAPVVKDYLFSDHTHSKLEWEITSILEKKDKGETLTAIELERDFQFQRFFTWKQETNYEVKVNLSGRFNSEHTMTVTKDFFDSVEEGDCDYDNSDILVDPYDLEGVEDGLDIEHSEVESKYFFITVWDLKIKDEFKNIVPDAESMIEGGAA